MQEIMRLTSGRHKASEIPFDELYEGLNKRVDLKLIRKQTHPEDPLEIYNYTNLCVYERAWDKFTVIARGLILDVENKVIIALTFTKFFNWAELLYELPNLPFTTTSKFDGSLGIIYYYNYEWHVATRGSFTSPQAQWAERWLRKNVNTNLLGNYCTYLVEIIYRENRIVVPYDFEGLVLLGGYNDLGGEISDKDLKESFGDSCSMVEKQHFDSVEQIAEIALGLSYDQEGFVVRFSNGFRIKIKGQEYSRIHKLLSGCTPLHIWDLMRNCDDLDAICISLPEEYREDFDSIRKLLRERFNINYSNLRKMVEETSHLTDKDLGKKLQEGGITPGNLARFIFLCRKKDFFNSVNSPGKHRDAFMKLFRPVNNILPGYVPSKAMFRIEQESPECEK